MAANGAGRHFKSKDGASPVPSDRGSKASRPVTPTQPAGSRFSAPSAGPVRAAGQQPAGSRFKPADGRPGASAPAAHGPQHGADAHAARTFQPVASPQGVRDIPAGVPRIASAAPQGATQAAPMHPASPYARNAAGRAGGPAGPGGPRGGLSAGTGSGPGNPGKPKPKRNVLSTVLVVVGVLLLLVAGGLFVKAQVGYKQAADFYSKLSSEAVQDTGGEGIPAIDFDALKQVNEDVVGWIYIPGTNISYVVVQGETNDTYLRTLIDGTYNENGSVFLDADNTAPGVQDQQTTLYGHHMNDGSMFAHIYQTLDQAVFDKVETVYYITPDATYEFEPMFTMRVEDDYTAARQANFDGDGGLAQYLSDSLKHAEAKAADAEKGLSEVDKILTLVTCDDAFLAQTKRAAMVCKLVGEVGASAEAPAGE